MPSSLLTWRKQTARYFFSNVGYIWDQQRTAVGVCNNGDSYAWQKEESSYREKEKVGRVIMNRALDFSLTEFLPGTKRSLFGVELCCGLRAWQLLDPGLQILFNLKNFSQLRILFFISQTLGNSHLVYCPLSCLSPSSKNPEHFPCLFYCNCSFMSVFSYGKGDFSATK